MPLAEGETALWSKTPIKDAVDSGSSKIQIPMPPLGNLKMARRWARGRERSEGWRLSSLNRKWHRVQFFLGTSTLDSTLRLSYLPDAAFTLSSTDTSTPRVRGLCGFTRLPSILVRVCTATRQPQGQLSAAQTDPRPVSSSEFR